MRVRVLTVYRQAINQNKLLLILLLSSRILSAVTLIISTARRLTKSDLIFDRETLLCFLPKYTPIFTPVCHTTLRLQYWCFENRGTWCLRRNYEYICIYHPQGALAATIFEGSEL